MAIEYENVTVVHAASQHFAAVTDFLTSIIVNFNAQYIDRAEHFFSAGFFRFMQKRVE